MHSEERKRAVLGKLGPPNNWTIKDLAAEEGISESTLYRWRKQARERGELHPDAGTHAEGWATRGKFAAVVETASMSVAKRAEYCRRGAIHYCCSPHRRRVSLLRSPRHLSRRETPVSILILMLFCRRTMNERRDAAVLSSG